MARIDWTAVGTAAGAGLALILAGAAVSAPLASRTGDWVVWPFLALVLLGFAAAGSLAGHLRPDTPMLHGALAAGGAFIGALAVGLVTAAVTDRSLSVAAVPVGALAAVTAGVGGGLLAELVGRRATLRRSGR